MKPYTMSKYVDIKSLRSAVMAATDITEIERLGLIFNSSLSTKNWLQKNDADLYNAILSVIESK